LSYKEIPKRKVEQTI